MARRGTIELRIYLPLMRDKVKEVAAILAVKRTRAIATSKHRLIAPFFTMNCTG